MNVNSLYKQGDTLRARLDVQTSTTLRLNQFSCTFNKVVGEQETEIALPNVAVKAEFRVIAADIFRDDWHTITSTIIPLTKAENGDVIEVRFTLQQEDADRYQLTSLSFNGLTNYRTENVPTIKRSIFRTVYEDPKTDELALNLFKKLYYRGIIPKYITRAENVDRNEDEDYIVLAQTIAKFFAMILRFFYRFENIYTDYDLLREWVNELGIYVNDQKVDLEQLQYLSRNFYNEINKRGTLQIFNHKGEQDAAGNAIGIDGEFIRLMRLSKKDTIIAEYMQLWQAGWCVGRISPLYTGVTEDNIIGQKTYSATESISINCRIDYLIQLHIKTTSVHLTALPKVMLKAYDENDEEITNGFIRGNGEEVTTTALSGKIKILNSQELYINIPIYAYNSSSVEDDTLSIGNGNSLAFFNANIKTIHVEVSDLGGATYTYTVKPMVRGKNILPLKGKSENDVQSWGFIQSARIFYLWTKNNNKTQSNQELSNIINHYLLPYNMANVIQITE